LIYNFFPRHLGDCRIHLQVFRGKKPEPQNKITSGLIHGWVIETMTIKLYALCTPSHAILRDEWFLPSLQDDYELVLENLDQPGRGLFHEEDFRSAILRKVELILTAIEENRDGWFLFSDIDVQFFSPTRPMIEKAIASRDLVFQTDNPVGTYCTGFFACRGNDRTRTLWQKALELVRASCPGEDQIAVNILLRVPIRNLPTFLFFCRLLGISLKKYRFSYDAGHRIDDFCSGRTENPSGIRVGYLPTSFFGGGTFTGRIWTPGENIPIPPNPVMHHANFCLGVESKVKMMALVKEKVSKASEC